MTEIDIEIAEIPAPDSEVTVPLEHEVLQPEEISSKEQVKTFTQDELDAIFRKRLAREHRKWEKQNLPKPDLKPPVIPTIDQFESPEEYAKAYADEVISSRETQKQMEAVLEKYRDLEEGAIEKHPDFKQVAYGNHKVTDVMAETIRASEDGPEIAYYLGSNPKESARIADLAPLDQIREIVKLEVKLSTAPLVKKSTNVPAPINPISSKGTGTKSYTTDDPRAAKELSMDEWVELNRKEQLKKLEAKRFQ